jgi:hypothetical protein
MIKKKRGKKNRERERERKRASTEKITKTFNCCSAE